MNKVKPNYSVSVKNNIIVAKITGDWDMHSDLGYLTALDEAISKVRAVRWALFADLRGWRVSEEVINFKHNLTIQLDRRNQQAECWLVDDVEQGSHIQHHITNSGVPLHKCLGRQEAEKCLMQYGFYL